MLHPTQGKEVPEELQAAAEQEEAADGTAEGEEEEGPSSISVEDAAATKVQASFRGFQVLIILNCCCQSVLQDRESVRHF